MIRGAIKRSLSMPTQLDSAIGPALAHSRCDDWRCDQVTKLADVEKAKAGLQDFFITIHHHNPGNTIVSPHQIAAAQELVTSLKNWARIIQEELEDAEIFCGKVERRKGGMLGTGYGR
jgi:hypothetical protein